MINKKTEIRLYKMEYVDGRQVRVYENGGVMQSAQYIEKGHHFDLVFDYMKKFNVIFDLKDDIKDILMIGGAGYSYPKYVISHYPDVFMDVVDIDPSSYENAKEFFYVDELIYEYHLYENKRLNPITDDGKHFLETTDKKYDVIINDAFNGIDPAADMLEKDTVKLIQDHLKENGIYMANLPGYNRLKKSVTLRNALKQMKSVFQNVYLLRIESRLTGSYMCNYVTIATDYPRRIDDTIDYTEVL